MSGNTNSSQKTYVWFNGNQSEPLESTIIRGEVEKINGKYRFCTSATDCEAYLKAQSSHDPIELIISGTHGSEMVPKIHTLPQIISIHVYCYNKHAHEQWARTFTKVKGVFTEYNELLRSLSLSSSSGNNDYPSNDRAIAAQPSVGTDSATGIPPETAQPTTATSLINPQESVLSKDETALVPVAQTEEPISTVSETETTASPAPEQNSSSFLYEADTTYYIIVAHIDLIIRMTFQPEEIGDYLSCWQGVSSGNEQLSAVIEEFRTNYSPDKAIMYLYSDLSTCPYLDNICKGGYVDAIYSSRVLIGDIGKQLEQHKCTTVTQLYLCELVFNEDFQRLQALNGRVIAMKYFLWTNTDREKAISYVSYDASNNEYKRLLFEIEADPQTANVKPFAKLDFVSTINDPDQVLVMLGSLLRIINIDDEKDGIINIKAQLCGTDDDNQIAKQINQIKQEHIDSNGGTDAVRFGQFQIALGYALGDTNLSNSGEKLIRDYHDKLQIDSMDHMKCCRVLGRLEFMRGEYDSSLANYKKVFDLKTRSSTVDDLDLAALHNDLGSVYCEMNDCDQALDHYQKAAQIWKTLKGDLDRALIDCYTNMANIHLQSERSTDAFYYYSQVEMILIKSNDTNSHHYALCCHNLGVVRTSLQQYHLALGHFKTSLEIKSTIFQPVHSSIASAYKCIGTVYQYMDCISQARDMFEQALQIYRQVLPQDDATIQELEQIIQDLPNEST
ncbi:unnamed protein product [Adineta ricciae]|uniref:Uncharacterized protein n=1 Tax=Adineta ricciae TaxID=249248 RepID=A0A814TNZ8_ADIRI|nr:unnamed protein product [Adineta ricciae]CAF1160688.1 unnamed protein product [Adineta ricciae]